MEIKAFNNKEKTFEYRDGWFITVDYLTPGQKYKLEQIMHRGTKINSEDIKKSEFSLADWNDYIRYYLKYTIKSWKGLYSEGKEVKCKVKDDELDERLWMILIQSDELVKELYEKTIEILRWADIDKKK